MEFYAKKLVNYDLLTIPIIILLIALLPLPTTFYILVKIIVFIFGVAIFFGLENNMRKERYTFLASAIVYNPFFPLYFGERYIWILINLIVLYFFWKLRKEMKKT